MSTKPTLYKQLYKELTKQLSIANKLHNASDLKRSQALLKYRGLESSPTTTPKFSKSFKNDLEILKKFENLEESHVNEIYQFLKQQRIYQTLLERYNPGTDFNQQDHVKRTANRVGLQIPDY